MFVCISLFGGEPDFKCSTFQNRGYVRFDNEIFQPGDQCDGKRGTVRVDEA